MAEIFSRAVFLVWTISACSIVQGRYPRGGYINQADGTAWMAMYSLNLMRIALELAKEDSVYEDIASKFFEHFLYIAAAMTDMTDTPGESPSGLWDEQDQFYYDMLNLPDGTRAAVTCSLPGWAHSTLCGRGA